MDLDRARGALERIESELELVCSELSSVQGTRSEEIRSVCASMRSGLRDVREELSGLADRSIRPAGVDPRTAGELAREWLVEEVRKWNGLTDRVGAGGSSDGQTLHLRMVCVGAGIELQNATQEFLDAIGG